jgi:hypothetical protein
MRKSKIIKIVDENRDQGRNYLITELPASQAEKWAARAFLALARSGVEVPPDLATAGMAGLAVAGLRALAALSFNEAEPLMDEMMKCVKIIPDMRVPEMTRALQEEDIEEVSTRIKLRQEVIQLHTDFFTKELKFNSTSMSG